MNPNNKIKLLYVEDEALQVKYITNILTNANFIVKNISNGKEALDYIIKRKNEFEVLVLDQNLPGLSGLEILETLKELKIEIPTIFLSTENNSHNIVKAIKLGAYDFVIKNCTLQNELPQIILNAKYQFELLEENKRLIRILKQNEEMFKGLFNNHSSIQFFIHPITGNFLMVNDTALSFFGETVNALYKKTILDYDSDFFNKLNGHLIKNKYSFSFETSFKLKNNLFILVDINISNINLSENSYYHVIVTDLSDKNKIQQSLKESNEKYRILVERMNEGLMMVDNNDKIQFLNKNGLKMLGYDSEELIGKIGYDTIVFDEDKKIVIQKIKDRIQKISDTYEIRLLKKDKTFIWVSMSGSPIFNDEGETIGSLGLFTDISVRKATLESLQKSEEKNNALLEALPDLIFVFDREANFIDYSYSESNSDSFLINPNNFIGKNLKDVIPELYYSIIKKIDNLFKTGKPQKHEYQLYKNNEVHYFESRLVLCGKDRVLSIIRNITDAKINFINLDKERRILNHIVENVIGGYWDWNLKEDTEYFSPKFKALLGYKDDELENHPRTWRKIVLQEDLEVVRKQTEIHFQSKGEIPFYSEIRYKHKNGSVVWVICSGFVIEWDENYNPIRMVGCHVDITERKKQELALQESEDKFKKVIEESADGFVISDSNGKIIDWNKKIEEITEYSKEEVINVPIWEISAKLLHEEDEIEKHKQLSLSIFDNSNLFEKFITLEGKIYTKCNRVKEVSSSKFLINSNSNKFLVRTIKDITDKKRNEDLLQKLEIAEKTSNFKQQFLANMSHEMRTPMNGIIGMTDFLLNTKLDATQFDYTQTIKDSSETLLHLLNEILVLSKIEAGKFKLNNSNFETIDLVNKSVNLFKALVKQKNLEFKFSLDEKIPKKIHADKHKIIQVISNLLNNAIKFTDTGKIELNFKLLTIYNNQCLIEVSIVDTGIGIPELDLEQIFDSFTQADNTNSRTHDGVGLGLTICKSLVDLLKGQINVQSKVGEGSRFWFTFIAETTTNNIENQTDRLQKEANISISPRYKLQVLLVEDKKVNQKVVQLMLKKLNCEVDIIENGKDAIEHLDNLYSNNKNFKYDLILMDIQMPLMDGEAAVKYLKSKYTNLPIIIGLSANAMEGDKEYYISIGMDDYLSKPVTLNDLDYKIMKWFN